VSLILEPPGTGVSQGKEKGEKKGGGGRGADGGVRTSDLCIRLRLTEKSLEEAGKRKKWSRSLRAFPDRVGENAPREKDSLRAERSGGKGGLSEQKRGKKRVG